MRPLFVRILRDHVKVPSALTLMVGDGLAVEADPDTLKVGGHVDQSADRMRVDRVVRSVHADVVVPTQADPVAPAQMQRDRGQRQHRREIRAQPIDWGSLDRADGASVRPSGCSIG